MKSNPYESPRPDQPPEEETWLTWVRISFGGIGLLLAGIALLGFITAVSWAPPGRPALAIVIAWFMIAIGLTVALIGGIGEFRSSSR